MESCLALAELEECNCSGARFAGFVKNICTEEENSTSLQVLYFILFIYSILPLLGCSLLTSRVRFSIGSYPSLSPEPCGHMQLLKALELIILAVHVFCTSLQSACLQINSF